MSDSPDFYSSEIRDYRFADFCVHTARLSGNRLQKVGRLEKIGQWDHGIITCQSNKMEPCFTLSLSKKKHTQLSKIWTKGIILTDFVLLVMKISALILVLPGSFHVKSTNASSMTISDFLHFAVYERPIIQEQNKKNLNLISPS